MPSMPDATKSNLQSHRKHLDLIYQDTFNFQLQGRSKSQPKRSKEAPTTSSPG